MKRLLAVLLCLLFSTATTTAASTSAQPTNPSCNASFLLENVPPSFLQGQNITLLSLSAVPVLNRPSLAPMNPPLSYNTSTRISFCNITLQYTHPTLNDDSTTTLTLHLPLTSSLWNGNFLAQGGGGYKAGDPAFLAPLVSLGYASATTDAGRSIYSLGGNPLEIIFSSKTWSLNSHGEVNRILLENFAYRSLGEMAILGKLLTRIYYDGEEVKWSYWHGCSTGGRQGMMVAQKFPGEFDGVLAVAPAIGWSTVLVEEIWAQVVMNALEYWPERCELAFVTREAVGECDGLDGVVDGVVGAPGLCGFDARRMVGRRFDCEGEERMVSEEAADVVNAAWKGPVDGEGKALWFGESRTSRVPKEDFAWDITDHFLPLIIRPHPRNRTLHLHIRKRSRRHPLLLCKQLHRRPLPHQRRLDPAIRPERPFLPHHLHNTSILSLHPESLAARIRLPDGHLRSRSPALPSPRREDDLLARLRR
jgi:hypothetical protein